MDTSADYAVRTKVTFLLNFDGSGEVNILALPDVQRAFAEHVQSVFQQDETLSDYIDGDLTFQFDGRRAEVEYTFSCYDESQEEAESFSEYCVKSVREDLEAFGCKLGQIHCAADEKDMTWLDQLEDAVFGPKGMEMTQ